MNHLSFYWLPQNKDLLVKGIESEFSQLVEHAVSSKKIGSSRLSGESRFYL